MKSVGMGGSFRRVSRHLRQRLAERLAQQLHRWATAIGPDSATEPSPSLEASSQPAAALETAALGTAAQATSPLAQCPAMREPVSIEEAVLQRSLAVLRREAADSLAALGAAHALVSSARLSQLQQVQQQLAAGAASPEALMTLAADYHGWQSDQVRIFDALALILRMRIPKGTALEQVGGELQQQARGHLSSLAVEYQRGLLNQQFQTPERGDVA